MNAGIQVKDRKEAALIRRGLESPEARAFVKIIGALEPLSDRGRARVLHFVSDKLDEELCAKP